MGSGGLGAVLEEGDMEHSVNEAARCRGGGGGAGELIDVFRGGKGGSLFLMKGLSAECLAESVEGDGGRRNSATRAGGDGDRAR